MRPTLLLLPLLACAGPGAHERPAAGAALDPASAAAPRATVATTLAPADPLGASSCALPSAPFVACPAADEPAAEPHHHHHAPAPPPADPHAGHGAAPPKPSADPHAEHRDAKVKDPVCGMMIDPKTAGGGSVTVNGVTTFFCSATCKRTFLSRSADGGTR